MNILKAAVLRTSIPLLMLGTPQVYADQCQFVNACDHIDDVFCGGADDVSSVGATGLCNLNLDSNQLTGFVNGSAASVQHILFVCGSRLKDSGYTNCERVGTFNTNSTGNGGFTFGPSVINSGALVSNGRKFCAINTDTRNTIMGCSLNSEYGLLDDGLW